MYFLLVLLVYLTSGVHCCPLDCYCASDDEYEDGVLVDCENLGLDEIPFDIPAHVTTLLLNFNNIRSIESLQYYTNLRALELQHNYLREMDAATLQSLPYLKILVLSENEIERIPSRAFRGMQYLEWVDLRGNQISSINQHAFYKAHSINYLNLVDNELSDISPGTLLPLTSYNLWLLLNNNSFTQLPADISKMSGLHYLSISNNELDYIAPQALLSNINLRTLDISGNRISYLHQGTFTGIHLYKLEVSGNPWQCDCYLEWLRVYLHSRQVEHSLTCSGPRDLRGVRMSSIRDPLVCLEPVIAAPEPEQKILEHQNTTLSCLVTGDPPPHVSWFKDGVALEPQANRYTDIVDSKYKLVFRSVMYTDAGLYSCVARRDGDQLSNSTIDLQVMYTPKILNSYKWSPNDESAMSDVTLACDVVSNPPLNKPITWAKESRTLTGREDGIKITRSGTGSILYLTNTPTADNSGKYRCIASNSLGETTEAFQVTHNDMLMLRSSSNRPQAASHSHYPFSIFLTLVLAFLLNT